MTADARAAAAALAAAAPRLTPEQVDRLTGLLRGGDAS